MARPRLPGRYESKTTQDAVGDSGLSAFQESQTLSTPEIGIANKNSSDERQAPPRTNLRTYLEENQPERTLEAVLDPDRETERRHSNANEQAIQNPLETGSPGFTDSFAQDRMAFSGESNAGPSRPPAQAPSPSTDPEKSNSPSPINREEASSQDNKFVFPGPEPAVPINRRNEPAEFKSSMKDSTRPAPDSEPTIVNVTIGRVEVRAVPQEPQKKKTASKKPSGVMTLDDYLKQREGGGQK